MEFCPFYNEDTIVCKVHLEFCHRSNNMEYYKYCLTYKNNKDKIEFKHTNGAIEPNVVTQFNLKYILQLHEDRMNSIEDRIQMILNTCKKCGK